MWSYYMRKANVTISIVLLGFSGFYAYLTANLPARNLPHTLGGDFVPWVLTIFLLFLSTLLLVKSLSDKEIEGQTATTLREYGGILLLFVIILLYIEGMLYFGYIITTPIFMGIMMRMAGSRRLWEMTIYPILTTSAIYILFSRIFEVALPEGKIF